MPDVAVKVSAEFRDLIPPLSEEEALGLEASLIAEGGARDALVVWKERGILLDGHHRHEICERLLLKYRVKELSFESKDEAKAWMIRNQVGRRNLSESQRALLAARLATLKRGDNQHSSIELTSQSDAADEFAVSVASVKRARMVLDHGTPELIAAVQADKIAVSVAAEIAELPEAKQKKLVADPPSAQRLARELKIEKRDRRVRERAEQKAASIASSHPLCGDRFKLIHTDVGMLETCFKEIGENSVDAIITDPPYPGDYLSLYEKLSELASVVLRPGGHCIAMVGQSHLPTVLNNLALHLNYQWTLAFMTPGSSVQVFGRKIKSNWKPVVWLTKGKNEWEHVNDVITGDGKDKRFHEWGQPVSAMAQIIERFTVPKSVILDPFVGGGGTAVAAVSLDRLFIGIDIEESAIKETAKRLAEL